MTQDPHFIKECTRGMKKQPFRLGTGGGLGFSGRGLGTYTRGTLNSTWRCCTKNKQPFRLGTGVECSFRGVDWGLVYVNLFF